MRSAAGLTKSTANRDLALGAEYMASKRPAMMVNHQAVFGAARCAAGPTDGEAGTEQGLVDGRFKMDFVPLSSMAGSARGHQLVNEIRFD
jgi:hypothetical protein